MNPGKRCAADVEFWLEAYTGLLMGPPHRRRGERDAWWPCPWRDGQELFVDLGKGIWRMCGAKGDFIELMRLVRAAGVPLA